MTPKIRLLLACVCLAASTARGTAQTANCPADLDFDRVVGSGDLGLLLIDFGDCAGCPTDLNGDGMVDAGDISLLLLDFGACPDGPGGDCPEYGTLKEITDPTSILRDGWRVGVRWSEIRYTGYGTPPLCGTYRVNFELCDPLGTLIGKDTFYKYYADGNCDYYREEINPPDPNPCQPWGTIRMVNWSSDILVTPTEGGCQQSFKVGLGARNQYWDGNCDWYWAPYVWRVWWYYPAGTVIGECPPYRFHSNGTGGYYASIICPAAGQIVSSVTHPVYSEDCGLSWPVGTVTIAEYTDGACGTYQSTFYDWYPYGTFLGTDGSVEYLSDGAGGCISQPCSSYGTEVGRTSETVYVVIVAEPWPIGDLVTVYYADGTCGTYNVTGYDYYDYGTYLGTDGQSNYYSDGFGGYYSQPVQTCDPSGTVVGTVTSDITAYTSSGLTLRLGSETITTYADGNCGSYETRETLLEPYGAFLGTDGEYNYYSDGSGGYYSILALKRKASDASRTKAAAETSPPQM